MDESPDFCCVQAACQKGNQGVYGPPARLAFDRLSTVMTVTPSAVAISTLMSMVTVYTAVLMRVD
jgi:hypothetical protein